MTANHYEYYIISLILFCIKCSGTIVVWIAEKISWKGFSLVVINDITHLIYHLVVAQTLLTNPVAIETRFNDKL